MTATRPWKAIRERLTAHDMPEMRQRHRHIPANALDMRCVRVVRMRAPIHVFKTTKWWNWECDICPQHGITSYWSTSINVGIGHLLFHHKDWRKQ